MLALDQLLSGARQESSPTMKMLFRSQWLGTGEAMTRSLDSAIMAPSLNTASSTMRIVGKYLRAETQTVKVAFCVSDIGTQRQNAQRKSSKQQLLILFIT